MIHEYCGLFMFITSNKAGQISAKHTTISAASKLGDMINLTNNGKPSPQMDPLS